MENKSPHINPPSNPKDLAELLKAVSQGDERAFASLVALYADTIYSQCLAYVKSVEKAEELSQDIFMEVWKIRAKLPELDSFENYLFVLAKHRIFRSFRKKVAELVLGDNAGLESGLLPDLNTPDLQTEYRDTYQLLLKGIDRLPEKRQRVFRMNRLEGMTHAQIAKELGIHEVTVAQYIVKSLSFLKTFLADHGTDTILLIILLRGLP